MAKKTAKHPTEDRLERTPAPEYEWHIAIRQRNADLRVALEDWLHTGDARALKRGLVLVAEPPFAAPASPRLRNETDRLLALALRAIQAPAVKGAAREQRVAREALLRRLQ